MNALRSTFFLTILVSLSAGLSVVKFESDERVALRLEKSLERRVIYSTTDNSISPSDLVFNCSTFDEKVAKAYVHDNYSVVEGGPDGYNVTFVCKLDSIRLGSTNVTATVSQTANNGSQLRVTPLEIDRDSVPVMVAQPKSVWNDVVQYGLLAALALNSVAFGLKIDWGKVIEFVKKPCGLLLALGCQYILLPGVAVLMGYALNVDTHIKVALLAVSCVPGGLPSNAITLALQGDINLSIVLTALGNIAAFAMTPLWMYTLGQEILEETFPGLVIRIPWLIFCIFIAVLTLPTIAGMAVGVRHPKIAHKLALVFRLVGISSALALVGILLWVYSWTFDYLNDWRVVVAGIVTPCIALLISFGLSLLALRSVKYAITISVETCIQNISFSFFLIRASIPEPHGSLAVSIPTIIVLATHIPLLAISLGKVIVEVVRSRRGDSEESSEGSVTAVSNSKLDDLNMNVVDEKYPGDVVFESEKVVKFHKSESTTALVDA